MEAAMIRTSNRVPCLSRLMIFFSRVKDIRYQNEVNIISQSTKAPVRNFTWEPASYLTMLTFSKQQREFFKYVLPSAF